MLISLSAPNARQGRSDSKIVFDNQVREDVDDVATVSSEFEFISFLDEKRGVRVEGAGE